MGKFKEFLSEAALTLGQIKKYPYRIELFKKKVSEGSLFELTKKIKLDNGEETKFVKIDPNQFSNNYTVDDLPKQLKIENYSGTIPLGYLMKTKEFGSSGPQGNKGNQYEKEFLNELNNFFFGDKSEVKDVKPILEIEKMLPGSVTSIDLDGGKNTKRPIHIGSRIYVGSGNNNIGKDVTDITINTTKGPVYLSLKYGSKVTLANIGISKILQKKDMEENKTITNKDGQKLLDMLCIDYKKFAAIFNDYVGKCNKKKIENITSKLSSNRLFKDFMMSIIGYGYVLVHKEGSHTSVIDMTESKAKNFIKVKKAELIYPLDGCAKRIDLKAELNGMDILMNIRSKTGSIYPTHIMTDYKIL